MQVVAENLVVLLARLILALFLSSVLGVLFHVVTFPVVESLSRVADLNFAMIGVLIVGTGAGIGSFLGWLNRDLKLRILILVLFLTLAATLLGAWGGLLNSSDAFKLSGSLGNPTIRGITVGAVLGGNVFNLAIWLVKTIKNPRI